MRVNVAGAAVNDKPTMINGHKLINSMLILSMFVFQSGLAK